MAQPEQLPQSATIAEKGFTIWRGWSEELAQKLVIASEDPLIKQFAPNDNGSRFTNLQAAYDWYTKKQPIVYSLMKNGQLGGITWFSANHRQELDSDYTFAIRMYPLARGNRLAQPFVEQAEIDFRRLKNPRGLWLETDSNNVVAQKLYAALGYKIITAGKVRMTMHKK